MALESASYISGLVAANPPGTDVISQGDDHLRLIKSVLKTSLPDVDQEAATIITKASAPTTQVRGTIWYDTSANLLKINTAASGATPSWATVNDTAPWASASAIAGSDSFRATISGTQTISTSTWTLLSFGTESWDTGSNFNTSTYLYTVPTTGKYFFNLMVRTKAGTSPTEDVDIAIYKNSSADIHRTEYRQAGGVYAVTTSSYAVSGIMDLSATDTVSAYIYTDVADWEILGDATTIIFSGFRLT
tara:strand:+ start:37 stop:777 length:741 start_codon:yes stop_codon:yes gene_type:complete